MTETRAGWLPRPLIFVAALLLAANAAAQTKTQTETQPFEPTVGQAGKDVVWVPTPQALVDKMLELAKVTPKDFLMDLGSGDGRTVITAAKLGATAMGIEYEPQMVELAKANAAKEGIGAKATFVKADLFETDFSKATVITMFLLPSINMKLRPKILDMKPGTRVASNTFTMEDWEPDQRETITNCTNWCTALLWIVPAKVDGAWQMPQGPLTIKQTFQNFTGTLGSTPITNGKLNGSQITFSAGNNQFSGSVNGNTIEGVMAAGGSKTNVKATRSR
jgi:Methyltransferase domain